MANLRKQPIHIKNGDLVFYRYTLPEDKHSVVYRGLGYIDDASIYGNSWVCKISFIDLINPFNEWDRIEIVYKSSIIKNFGDIQFDKFTEEFPEWII